MKIKNLFITVYYLHYVVDIVSTTSKTDTVRNRSKALEIQGPFLFTTLSFVTCVFWGGACHQHRLSALRFFEEISSFFWFVQHLCGGLGNGIVKVCAVLGNKSGCKGQSKNDPVLVAQHYGHQACTTMARCFSAPRSPFCSALYRVGQAVQG